MTRYFLQFPVPKKYLVIVTRYFLETGVAKFTIWDFSHADFGFFTCLFCGFGFLKTDYVGVSRLRSSIFFLAFVLFFDFDFAKLGGPKKEFLQKSLSLFHFFWFVFSKIDSENTIHMLPTVTSIIFINEHCNAKTECLF